MNTKKIKSWMPLVFYVVIIISCVYALYYVASINREQRKEDNLRFHNSQKTDESEEMNPLLKAAIIYYFISQ